jgi:hypothetical protein
MTADPIRITPQPTATRRYPASAGVGRAAAPAQAGDPPRQCSRCGAVDTHYLTCPSLRLPAGYRLSQDPVAYRADHGGEQSAGYRAGLVSGRCRRAAPGGPDHPDWPRRPQR